jgi:hypothetical protein
VVSGGFRKEWLAGRFECDRTTIPKRPSNHPPDLLPLIVTWMGTIPHSSLAGAAWITDSVSPRWMVVVVKKSSIFITSSKSVKHQSPTIPHQCRPHLRQETPSCIHEIFRMQHDSYFTELLPHLPVVPELDLQN